MLHADLLEQARGPEPQITALRRAIHAEPELGLHTPTGHRRRCATRIGAPAADVARGAFDDWAGRDADGAEAGSRPGAVLPRGDMDALEMPDKETGLEFASGSLRGGCMPAGTMRIRRCWPGAAELLCARRADKLAGEVQFMLQPGEEGHHGARFMIDDGLLEPKADAAFALHITPNSPHGMVAGRGGARCWLRRTASRSWSRAMAAVPLLPHDALGSGARSPARSSARSRRW